MAAKRTTKAWVATRSGYSNRARLMHVGNWGINSDIGGHHTYLTTLCGVVLDENASVTFHAEPISTYACKRCLRSLQKET